MKKLQNYFWICFGIAIICYFIYKVTFHSIAGHFIEKDPQYVKAIIIDEKNYMGNHSSRFSYSYEFVVEGKHYVGNAYNPALKIGDTVEVEFYKSWPTFNRPVHATG